MMPTREFAYGTDARSKLYEGIKLLNDAVSVTLGPAGRNASIHMGGQLVRTSKDGITVAEQVRSPNEWTEMGIQMTRESSDKCNESAGDGTTSAIVMTHALCKQVLHLPEGTNVIKVKNGMQKAVDACVAELKKLAVPCKKAEDYKKVALISSQDEEIAEKVTDVFMKSGKHGVIDKQYHDEPAMIAEHMDGFVIEKGCLIELSREVVLEDVPILVTDKKIQFSGHIFPLMKELAAAGLNKLLIVCDTVEGQAKGIISDNINNGAFMACPITAPSYGKFRTNIMKDICAATGAAFVSEEENLRLDKISLQHLGRAKRVTVGKNRTIIISLDTVEIRENITSRIESIETSLQEDHLDDIAKAEAESRLAALTDGVSVIKYGAQTEGERHERGDRITDAIEALRSAREEGIVIGGGSSYLRCVPLLNKLKGEGPDEQWGITILRNALLSVTLRVLEVAGEMDKELIVSRIIEQGGHAGFDFKKGEIGDLLEAGVIEPAKVCRCVLQNAVSCAGTFLSTELAIRNCPPTSLEQLAATLRG